MPIYEYVCMECKTIFEELRPIKDADEPIPCHACSSLRTSRKISVFFAHSEGRSVAGTASACGSCAATTCSTCSVPH
jgi:putative FmdB family regulatory protein